MAKTNPIQKFKKLLEKVKAKFPEKPQYWAAIGPKWSEEEILAFEKKNRVNLPKEFKEYLMEIGDGPGFVWHGHDFCLKDFKQLRKLGKTKKLNRLHKPFPLTRIWWGEGSKSKHNQKLPKGANLYDGTIPMGISEEHGHYFLVVNGSEAGKVWVDLTGNENSPIGSTKKTFMELNLEWINKFALGK